MHLQIGLSARNAVRHCGVNLADVLVVLTSALFCVSAAAQPAVESGHAHEDLIVDTGTTLADVLDATVREYPTVGELGARREQADAWRDRGESWIAGPPSFSFRYQTDRYDDDAGLQELESGIQFALWKWGERESTRDLGQAFDEATDAASAALRWEVAGTLREVVWKMARADGELDVARESMEVADRLARIIRRRHELGDVALGDVLLAESSQLDAQARLGEAQAVLVDAERSYRTLTLLDRRPSFTAETLSSLDAIDAAHPGLRFVAAQLASARAAQQLERNSALTSPTLTIGPRRERSVYRQPFEDSLGVTLVVPFGGGSHVRTRTSDAGRQVASAESTLRLLARELDLRMHEAAHGLEMARSNLTLAKNRSELAERSYRMGESAYSKGELGLIALLNLRSVSLDARLQALRFDIEEKRQTALYNQAVGVMP